MTTYAEFYGTDEEALPADPDGAEYPPVEVDWDFTPFALVVPFDDLPFS